MNGSPPNAGIGPDPDDAGGLDELRRRLDALQESVERLGMEGTEAPQPPPPPQPPTVDYPEAEAAAVPPGAGVGAYPSQGAATGYVGPRVGHPPPESDGPAGEAGADRGIAPTIVRLEVGPIATLAELRRFEEAIAGLDSVLDARVRRFGHMRAEIEVGLSAPRVLLRELQRLGLPMQAETGAEGRLVVELGDPGTGTQPSG